MTKADDASKNFLKEKLMRVRHQTETLCEPLSSEDCMLSATEETSPPKWHLAHTTWFFEYFILRQQGKDFPTFNPTYPYLFNSYYQIIGAYLPKKDRSLLSRPSLTEVKEYRLSTLNNLISLIDESNPEEFQAIQTKVELGIHHEQQHQELLLMDVKRNFFAQAFQPAYFTPSLPEARFFSPESAVLFKKNWQAFPEGIYEMGYQGKDFHYDNETGRHRVWLDAFELSPYLVTNEEYREFVEAKGYENPKFWLSDGWEYLQKEKWNAPLYWKKDSAKWTTMTYHGTQTLNLTEPVSHLSYYEAQAYANFRNARLPTEYEWEQAAQSYSKKEGQFLESGTYRADASKNPFADLHGELWQWTQSAYLPYPRYKAFVEDLGEYNSKFMCNQFVLRGGSCVTAKDHYRSTYRNFYYPHQRWQFSGLRLARDEQPS